MSDPEASAGITWPGGESNCQRVKKQSNSWLRACSRFAHPAQQIPSTSYLMKNVSRAYRLSAHEFKACANVCLKVYTCIFCIYLFPWTVCVRRRVCQVGVSCVRLCMCACVGVCSDNCDSCAGSV